MWGTNPALGLDPVPWGAQTQTCSWIQCHVGHKPSPGVRSSAMGGTNPGLGSDPVPCGAQTQAWGQIQCHGGHKPSPAYGPGAMWGTNPPLGSDPVPCGAQTQPCIWTWCHEGHKPSPGVGSGAMWGTNPALGWIRCHVGHKPSPAYGPGAMGGTNPDLHMDLVPCGAQIHPWGWTWCPLRVLSKPNLFHPLLSAHPDSLCSQWRNLAQPPPKHPNPFPRRNTQLIPSGRTLLKSTSRGLIKQHRLSGLRSSLHPSPPPD